MKIILTACALVAAIATSATRAATNATSPSLNYTLSDNAIEVLTANGIWAPNLTAFATNDYDIDGVNFTEESEKLVVSGLNVNDLVHVHVDETGMTITEQQSCDHCDLCLKACVPMLLLWPLWVDPFLSTSSLPPPTHHRPPPFNLLHMLTIFGVCSCAAACTSQSYCDGCHHM